MTTRQRLSASFDGLPRWQRWTLNAGALVSAILVLVAATKPIWRPVAQAAVIAVVDSTFVRQQSYEKDTLLLGISHKQEVDSIFRMLRDDKAQHARTDSTLRCFRRAKPDWCG